MKITFALGFLALFFITSLYFLASPIPPPPKSVLYKAVSFEALSGWQHDNHDEALEAFRISCQAIQKYPDERRFNSFGVAKDWKIPCDVMLGGNQSAKSFFETHFTPYKIIEEQQGLFTGYYAPLYSGSRMKSPQYDAPLYTVPSDLQALNLGEFDSRLSGQSIIGEVRDGKFVPYKNRKEIDEGALSGQGLELVWLENPEDAFFMQIQGSGFIELQEGGMLHLGYAQRNGRPYRAIGQYLIQSGDVQREDMSLQSIRTWMEHNPEKSFDLMWKNPSYVFFQVRETDRPIGSQGVGLTPGRSLAVDRAHIPMGMPLWLETFQEPSGSSTEDQSLAPNLQRLVIAQDTGGAIKGKVRGDVYWGIGDEAELKAGPMKDQGIYYLLVPNSVTPENFDGTL